jgi:1,4-dihydroxy-2-naphthoyl-CoA hydrolase
VSTQSKPSIWHIPFPLEKANRKGLECANGHLGMELLEVGDDFLKGRMPVDPRTRQPAGVLHGGVSVALAETLASWAAAYVVDPSRFHCVGQEINANHVRGVSEGWVYGEARPHHIGKKSHVWEVKIKNEDGQLVCISRITMAVLDHPIQY